MSAPFHISHELAGLRPVLDTALDAVVVMRADGTIADWNAIAESTFGWSRDQAVGHLMSDLIVPPAHREAHIRGLAHYLATGIGPVLNKRIEITAVHRDGRELPIELSITTVGAPGQPLFLGFLRDISERKRTENMLAARARHTELLARVTALASQPGSIEDALNACLSAICDITGWPIGHAFLASRAHADELLPSMIWHMPDPDRFAALRDATRQFRFTPGVGLPGRILQHQRPEWIADAASDPGFVRRGIAAELGIRAAFGFPVISGGRVVAVLEFFSQTAAEPDAQLLHTVDAVGGQLGRVLERKSAEAALRDSESRLGAIFAKAAAGISEVAPDGRFVRVNDELCRLLGRSREELLRLDVPTVTHPTDVTASLAAIERVAASGQAASIDKRYLRPDGSIVWANSNITRLDDENGRMRSFLAVTVDLTERKRAEEHQQLLINELNHRVKNTLAIVQAIAQQTFKGPSIPPEARRAFEGRLAALSAAHNLLTQQNWQAAPIQEIIGDAVAAIGSHTDRVRIDGPDLLLAPKTAVSLAMAVHELATNAVKYGSLSVPDGRVEICWRVAEQRLKLVWRERGGPAVVPPVRRGFGTRMIERGLAAELEGTVMIEFRREGLVCIVDAPVPQAGA